LPKPKKTASKIKECKWCGGTDHATKKSKNCKQNPKHAEFDPDNIIDPFYLPKEAGKFYLKAFTSIEDYDSIAEDSIGSMNFKCTKCNSYNFKDEMTEEDGVFSICCHKGKVNLPPIQEPPPEIKHLFTGNDTKARNFQEHIRNYNSANAFASMIAKLDPAMRKSGGPYFFKVNGEVTHVTSKSCHPEKNKPREYSQIYFLDSQTAVLTRMENKANNGCLKEVMEIIDRNLRKINPFYHSYKKMFDVEKEEQQKAKNEGSI